MSRLCKPRTTWRPLDAESCVSDQTLPPGVYTSYSSLKVIGTLSLNCQLNHLDSVWIFQITSTLTMTEGAIVQFVNCMTSTSPKVYWDDGITMVGTMMALF
eukprot:gene24688-31058_t